MSYSPLYKSSPPPSQMGGSDHMSGSKPFCHPFQTWKPMKMVKIHIVILFPILLHAQPYLIEWLSGIHYVPPPVVPVLPVLPAQTAQSAPSDGPEVCMGCMGSNV